MNAYVLSTGIITAIGNNTRENLDALNRGKAGITFPEILQTKHRLPVGEIKADNRLLASLARINEHLPRTALLSIIAAREAWAPVANVSAGLRIALVSANTVGGMDLTEHYYRAFKDGRHPAPELVRFHECGAITALTVNALGLGCWNTTISTACSSSANSLMLAAKLIRAGKYDIVIAGGADSLSRFTLNGFNSLMILDKEPSRPFDQNRRGLNLGEGAAYLVLGNEKALQQTGLNATAVLSGYANANDAHHQTASSPEGTGNKLAMQLALKQAGIKAAEVSYINLHGTGTDNNDAAEGKAVLAVFGGQVPPASSTKAFTGHTLGAAGAVEAVYAVLSIQQQAIWPHLRLQQKIEDLGWTPNQEIMHTQVNHVLSNSFGFGGNCSSLVFSKS